MPRPTTKTDLIKLANAQYEKLWELVNSMSMEQQVATFHFDEKTLNKAAHWKRDKNIRDILVHLYEWHQLLLNWVNANQNGENKPFLPSPYNWKNYADMNVKFFEKHQNTSYLQSKEMLKESHNNVMKMIEIFSNEELFTKKHFTWTGTTTLGSYCISATSSHYDWAIKKIKKHIKK
ncbi:ClbS/DfsB family four-helix bundle protein [Lentisphaerota bacterium WC36G]|nr:ClbS/DfsB family four-helix bundle protein [Lentisphaerae bacterium WC36]